MNTTGVLPDAFARSTSSASVMVVVLDMFLLVLFALTRSAWKSRAHELVHARGREAADEFREPGRVLSGNDQKGS